MSESVLMEATELSAVLKNWVEKALGPGDLSGGDRWVLERLVGHGKATVPSIARERRVSRQHVQQIVDSLAARGLVERLPNPAHRRSPLVAASSRGRALAEGLQADLRRALETIRAGTSDEAERDASEVLRRWRMALLADLERREEEQVSGRSRG
ncbi:MAG: MarR family transcriptional regulator [Myxococcota bacterium]